MNTRSRPTRSAFTLIELLIVMAIIILLAGLAVFGIGRARTSAASTVSLNQFRQIGAGLGGYIGDHSGSYPPSWFQDRNLTHVEFLNTHMYDPDYDQQIGSPYGRGVYLRPGRERLDSVWISPFRKTGIEAGNKWGHPHTYGANPALFKSFGKNQRGATMHTARVGQPGSLIAIADIWTNERGGGGADFHAQREARTLSGRLDEPVEVHDHKVATLHYYENRLHALMADGSCRIFQKGTVLRRHLVGGLSR